MVEVETSKSVREGADWSSFWRSTQLTRYNCATSAPATLPVFVSLQLTDVALALSAEYANEVYEIPVEKESGVADK